ncbi:MAG: PIN domain-containing protein [Thermodesulfovibrionales bacterium]
MHFFEVESKISVIKDDPTDNIFLECAIDGKADYIIFGDHHLLDLGNYEGIEIIKPKEFLIKEGFI